MTAKLAVPPAPGPLEDYAAEFDALFGSFGQRRSFRQYLAGLLAPRDRNKTLTALAGAEPIVQAQAAPVQRLQYFLSEAAWEAEALTARRLALLQADPSTRSHAEGVLVLDDTGDRKDGCATAHVARQYLGSVGKIDQGIVAVTTHWADARVHYPLHVAPYTPARHFAAGKSDARFRTKPVIAVELIDQARASGIAFRALVADCFYGDNDEFVARLMEGKIPYVLAHRGGVGRGWAREELAHSFKEAIEEQPLSAWQPLTRRFRDGHEESWWVIELAFLGFGPKRPVRALCATTDPIERPDTSTWYLSTTLRKASLEEIIALYALRNWVEEGYKRVKGELGWADFQVRSDRAIRRHWALVTLAFSFCWWHAAREGLLRALPGDRHGQCHRTREAAPLRGSKKKPPARAPLLLAAGTARRARVAGPEAMAHAVLGRLERSAPARAARRAPHRCVIGTRPQPVSPQLTNHR